MEYMNVFSEKFQEIISNNVQSVLLGVNIKDDKKPEKWNTTNDRKTSCTYCCIEFNSLQSQRDHFKLDWHRYNLKQSLLLKLPISEEEFIKKTDNDDLSSISGSDSEKEDTLDTYATAQGKCFLQNDQRLVFSLYKCLIFGRKEEHDDNLLKDRLKECCSTNNQWTILMLGGGHFAGAVFRGQDAIFHKTFHCYTVRAGQGGSQSARDSKSSGSHPKSAGASLRRYNEQALMEHVKAIVVNWKSEIDNSSLIIYRASGSYNRSVLFGGIVPLLEPSNRKLRTIPFSTRRATFTEVKRVHSLLATAEVYESLENATEKYALHVSSKAHDTRNKIRSSCINRAKSREIIERPLPTAPSSTSSSENEFNKIENIDLEIKDECISFDLQEFEDTLTREQRKKPNIKKKNRKSKYKKAKEHEAQKKKKLVDAIVQGDLEILKIILEINLNPLRIEVETKHQDNKNVINQILDDNLNTSLHLAALNEQNEIMKILLENNADPCLRNKNSHTPYSCTQSKEIRETLREFARENPNRYNYNKAQIPTNALTKGEIADKKKAQRKVKKEKEKEKKKGQEIIKKEQDEKNRFLMLSDSEKDEFTADTVVHSPPSLSSFSEHMETPRAVSRVSTVNSSTASNEFTSRKRKRSRADDLLMKVEKQLDSQGQVEDQFDVIGKNVAHKLRSLPKEVAICPKNS